MAGTEASLAGSETLLAGPNVKNGLALEGEDYTCIHARKANCPSVMRLIGASHLDWATCCSGLGHTVRINIR